MTLRTSLATPEGKSRYVRRLFSTIADRYDLITSLLSYGQDRRWKRRLIEMAAPRPGERALDLACGTGDLAFAVAEKSARTIALDITYRMVQLARLKAGRPAAHFIVGDMAALPFPDASFDLVTTGYGLRNVPHLEAAIDEIHRVLRPRGRLFSLDFNRPDNRVVRAAYLGYLTVVGSALGLALHADPDTYRYIPESIRRHPGAGAVARLMRRRGFDEAGCHRVLGGLMAINFAVKAGQNSTRAICAPREIA